MMTKLSQRLLLLVALFLGITTSACARPAEQTPTEPPVQGDTIEVMSTSMQRNIKNVVIVPAKYFDKDLQDQRYPVLYLLHGAYGCYNDWSRKANLDSLSDGQDSWYVDSPVDPKMQFETYVSKELVEYIDNHYRTHANRYMRAITGLSMGGHGSLLLAFRHPDVFWSCGSMSGCMNITRFPDNWHIKDRLGEYKDNKQQWEEHAVCNQLDKVKASTLKPAQNIIIDDGLKDIFYPQNMAMHELLVEKEIDHDFIIRPGAHTWTYWVNALDYHFVFFSKAFARGAKLMQQEQP